VSLPWIFFGIIPTNLIALLLFASYLKNDNKAVAENSPSKNLSLKNYWGVWKDILQSRNGIRFLAGLTLLFNTLSALGILLIPIYAYIHGANLQEIIILGIVEILPQLFASVLGKVADAGREKLIVPGMAFIALIVGSFVVVTSYPYLLSLVFALQIILVLLGLVVENLVTAKTTDDHYGRTSAVFEGLKDVGMFAGAIGFGFAIDGIGTHVVFPLLAIIIAVIAIAALSLRPLRKTSRALRTHRGYREVSL
jgi:predicted MFS family arabinose efflux permease